MAIAAKDVKELRERTGVGMMECKGALEEAGGDMEKAIDLLRARGAAKAAKRSTREASEGVIGSVAATRQRMDVSANILRRYEGRAIGPPFLGAPRPGLVTRSHDCGV